MSEGAIILMIVILSLVWGGFAISLWFAAKQESDFAEEEKVERNSAKS